MHGLRTTLITASVIAILFAPAAGAQPTAAKVAVASGNGQLICRSCAGKLSTFFHPMVVKVTDANGNPIAGKTVNWQEVGFTPLGGSPSFDTVTLTDSNGLSTARLFGAPVTPSGTAFTPFLQSVISATVDNASATFYETQALITGLPSAVQIVFAVLDTPPGTVMTGPSGSTSSTPIQLHVLGYTVPVPNVSVRILSPVSSDPEHAVPSASCATGPGADPGSVLTDANGNANCFPVFGPVAGSALVDVLVGGVDPAFVDPTSPANGFQGFGNAVQIVVTPATPGRVAIVTGNNQSVNPGQSSAPLVVQVTDATGAATIANQKVAWSIFPAGQAILSQASTTTDALGQTQITVSFLATAGGSITVTAALASNPGISTTFNLTTNVQIASLAKISGDQQTTQAGQNFAAPLIVQVNGTNGQPLSNQSVSFLVSSGTATLSTLAVLTDASGQAKIVVTAGNTPGTVTIKAFIGSVSIPQPFTLTIIPPGPSLSIGSFANAGGASRIGALSPCSLVTVIAAGLAPNVQGMVFNANAFGPWATTLASDTVTVNNLAAPIYSVGNVNTVEQLTFQVPCDTALANSVPITINVAGGSATINFPVVAANPGIFETVMSDGVRRAVVVRPDGSFVSLQNPARQGEVVRVLVTGMGPVAPVIGTGALPVPGADSLVLGQVIVGVNNAGARVVTARVSPNLIGVYELAFEVPSDSPTGNDVVLSVAVNAPGDSQTRFSNGSKLPIH